MALWNNKDEAASAPKHTVDVVTGNTGVQAFENTSVGTWGVDTTEARAKNVNGHAGWVLRTVGTGGRAGRVLEETLVAMGSMSGDSEDTVFPDAILRILTQPSNASVVANTGGSNTVTLSVVVEAQPDATITYQWQYYNGTWGSVVNGTPANTTYTGGTTATLTIIPTNTDADSALYRVIVSSAGADSVTSNQVTLTVL